MTFRVHVRRYQALWSLAGVIGFVLLWTLLAHHLGKNQVLPPPLNVGREAANLASNPQMIREVMVSLRRLSIGFAIGSSLGVGLAMLLSMMKPLRNLIDPFIELIRPVPPLAALPILLFIFGIGEGLPISVVAFVAFKPAYVTAFDSIRNVDLGNIEVARVLGAGRLMIAREVLLPASLPEIFSGLRIAMALSWMSIVAAEMIGTTSGIGFSIMYNRQFVLVNKIIFGMVLIGITGALLDRLVVTVERWVIPWRATGEE